MILPLTSGLSPLGYATFRNRLRNYQFYRFVITAFRGDDPYWQFSELNYYSKANRLTGETASTNASFNSNLEWLDKPNDGDVSTKLCVWRSGGEQWLAYDFGSPVTASSYRWATANDSSERDPIRWRVEASGDGTLWTILDDRSSTDQDVPDARQTFTASFAL